MKPKVMILITGLGVGGAERFLSRILPKIEAYQITVVSMLAIRDMEKPLRKAGISVIYLNDTKTFKPLRSFLRFRKVVKTFQPQLLLTFLLPADIFGRICAKLFRIPTIASSVRNDYTHMSPRLANWERRTSGMVDYYLPNSEGLRPYLEQTQGIPKEKIRILPVAIDIDAHYEAAKQGGDIRQELGLSKNTVLCINVARLKAQKDQMTIVKAFAHLEQDAALLIVGEGEEQEVLAREIREQQLEDRVFLLGSRKDVAALLYQSDVFLLPSKTEGMSNALLEAMTLGCTCIVSDIAQNTAVITHEKTGLVVPVGMYTTWQETIERVFHERALRERLGRAAQEEIKEQYTIEQVTGRFEKLLGNMLAGK